MIKRFTPKSEFSRSILTLMTDTALVQALPLATAPSLTRIYSPEKFGLPDTFINRSVTICESLKQVSLLCHLLRQLAMN